MLEMLAELIDEYSDFQRSRPDLPQGSLCDLSQDELELLVAEFHSQIGPGQGADGAPLARSLTQRRAAPSRGVSRASMTRNGDASVDDQRGA
jgi:hypothetical protein